MDGFRAFKYYTAVKLHFTSQKYDVFVTNGRVKSSMEKFVGRNDRMIFEKLARQFKLEKEYIQYIASNFMYDNPDVVYDPNSGMTNYKEYLRRRQSMTKIFRDDLSTIAESGAQYEFSGNKIPDVLQLYMAKQITLETMVILNKLDGVVSKFKQIPHVALLLDSELSKIEKSAGFVKFDKQKVADAYMQFKEEQQGTYHG